jgi:guanylate kinase
MRDAGELLEWAEVHGNYYGTPRELVESVLIQGRDVLFDIDYQGTQQVRQKAGNDVVTIFILPPSMKELQARLERRAEDAVETIAKRLDNARNEILRWTQYDYVLINDDLQKTFGDLLAILAAERSRAPRLKEQIASFVEQLLQEK